jgi:hypothetical protein
LEITKYLWFKSVEKMREKFKTRRNSGENVIVVGPTTNTPMQKESCILLLFLPLTNFTEMQVVIS